SYYAPSPPVTFDRTESTTGKQGVNGQYAWHRTRVALRGAIIFVLLLAVFLTLGLGRPRYSFSCFLLVNIPLSLTYNIADLLTTSLNTRGIHPYASVPADAFFGVILIAGGIFEFLGAGAVDAGLGIVASLVHFAEFGVGWAVWKGRGRRVGPGRVTGWLRLR
ncbi:hypothetical protein EJ02DRAFT_430447, partial [Clathrospora elynae]